MTNAEEMRQATKELEEARAGAEAAIEELKTATQDTAISIATRTVVAVCAMKVVDALAGAFLPKNLRGVAKVGVAAGTYLIPELIANKAGDAVNKILKED